jgi:hypothetical protein
LGRPFVLLAYACSIDLSLLTTPPLGVYIAVLLLKRLITPVGESRGGTFLLCLYNNTSMEEDVKEEMMEGDMVE